MSKDQHNQLSHRSLRQLLLLAGIFFSFVKCQVKVILTASFPPMIDCTIGDDSRSSFSGLDIEMFDKIAAQIGWSEADYSFKCIQFSDLSSKIQDTSSYIGFFGGQTIDSAREQEGYVFSYPMWNTGISIILYDNLDFWFQVSVLTWQISLSLVGTALGIGVLQFFFEKREQSLEQFLWNSMTSMFFITTINLKRNASRLLQICFWFIVLIVGSTYIARATNLLTIDRPLYQIKTPYDLNHRRVITYSLYKYDLFQYGAIPLTSDFGPNPSVFDEISTDLMIKYLSRDDDYKVDGFVVDDIQAQISERMHCNLFIAGRSFYQFSYGIAFYKTQSQALIQQINSAILTITLEQSSEALISSYIQKKYPECDKGAKNDSITMDHVGGLYVIQGITLGCGLFIFIVTKIPLYRRLSRKLVSLNIQSAESKEDEKELQGDELVAANIKQAAKEQITAFQAQIEDRLDEMDENIIKFYEILLNEDQLKKNKIIVDFDMHPAPPSQSRRHEESLQQSQFMMYTGHTKEDEPILANNNNNNNNDMGDFNNASNRKITNSKYIYKGSNYLSIPIAKDVNNSNNNNLSNCSSNPNNNNNNNNHPNNNNRDTSIELRKETELIDFGETEVTSEIQDDNQISPGLTADKKGENQSDRSNINANKSLDKQQVYSDSEEPPNHKKPREEMNISQ